MTEMIANIDFSNERQLPYIIKYILKKKIQLKEFIMWKTEMGILLMFMDKSMEKILLMDLLDKSLRVVME